MEKTKSKLTLLLILCFALITTTKIITVEADSSDCIQFSSGLTVFSPVNTTYNSRFVTLNMTFDIGAGLDCSLNYSIDSNDLGAIPLVWVDTGYRLKGQKSGLLQLPELSEGTHYLTIDVLCGLYDYQGNPPGAPFTPTFPGSSDYTATWTHTIQFTIDTSTPDGDGNWVEVLSVSGNGVTFGDSPPFKINHVEWRIKWAYTTLIEWDWNNDFSFYVEPHEGGNSIASIRSPDERSGTLDIFYHTGDFHLSFPPCGIINWTVVVEENTDSPIQTENWVKVATLTGQGGISSTDIFTVEHDDWRILWEVELNNETEWPILQAYILPQTEIEGTQQRVGSIQMFVNEQTSGILRVYNQSGSFYINVDANIKNYTIIVEQNIESIPEFSANIVVGVILILSSTTILFKKLGDKQNV